MNAVNSAGSGPTRVYRAVWRWHFLVGMLVLPFLFMLAFTGLLM